MPRAKRNSKVVEQAQRRLESMQSIDPALDFGGQISLVEYTTQIEKARSAIAQYNTLLSNVDEAQKVVEAIEQKLAKLSSYLLRSVGMRYGEDSVEFMKAGGKTRSSKRQVNQELSVRLAQSETDSATTPSLMTTFTSVPVPARNTMNKNRSRGAKVKG
jgi:hypothetical protein